MTPFRKSSVLLFGVVFCLVVAQFGAAQQRDRGKEKSPNSAASGMTKAREAAALAFVREHHGELESLLIQLKESQPKKYELAIRDLFRTSERLAGFLERDPQRHDLELQAWQAKSRVQLLSATLLMTPSDKQMRGKLKQALLDESQVRRRLLTLDRERTTKRLQRLDSQIESIENHAERTADRQIKLLLDGAGAKTPQKATTKEVN